MVTAAHAAPTAQCLSGDRSVVVVSDTHPEAADAVVSGAFAVLTEHRFRIVFCGVGAGGCIAGVGGWGIRVEGVVRCHDRRAIRAWLLLCSRDHGAQWDDLV